ncbi:hypothetical protein EDB92DRAFT_145050 [Lactarius akahatsu]|uniref:Uncharacterized protein n=1 Tax=Lactarius akahatsu TaxID=416441 RepID=A0AAD4Q8X9_9AGAM|nr:hypothetical protein EDB92DRAFT_145050 [Lactarius akahatsu]
MPEDTNTGYGFRPQQCGKFRSRGKQHGKITTVVLLRAKFLASRTLGIIEYSGWSLYANMEIFQNVGEVIMTILCYVATISQLSFRDKTNHHHQSFFLIHRCLVTSPQADALASGLHNTLTPTHTIYNLLLFAAFVSPFPSPCLASFSAVVLCALLSLFLPSPYTPTINWVLHFSRPRLCDTLFGAGQCSPETKPIQTRPYKTCFLTAPYKALSRCGRYGMVGLTAVRSLYSDTDYKNLLIY